MRVGNESDREEVATMVNTNPRRAKPRNPQFRVSGKYWDNYLRLLQNIDKDTLYSCIFLVSALGLWNKALC